MCSTARQPLAAAPGMMVGYEYQAGTVAVMRRWNYGWLEVQPMADVLLQGTMAGTI